MLFRSNGDTVVVHAERDGDTPYTSKLNCVDGSGPLLDIPAGTYTVWMEITDHSGATRMATSGAKVPSARPAPTRVSSAPTAAR